MGIGIAGVWSFQLGKREVWDQLGPHFTLRTEAKIAELLGIPSTVSQCALLRRVYTGDSFYPAPRRSVDE